MGQRLDNAKALYLRAIGDGDYVEAITDLSGARYTQHSTPVRDGREGFIKFFQSFTRRNPSRDIQIVRSFEDGQYVFLHVLQFLNDGEFQYVTADIFDTDDDARLIEHWDVIEELRVPTVGERTQLDGPAEATEAGDAGQTENNKALVRRYVHEVLGRADHDRIAEFVTDDLAQHHPDIGDGAKALWAYARAAHLRYVDVHLVIGSGDFVAVLAHVEAHAIQHAVIDLFRVQDDQIVEQWSVAEEITPESTWVNSGKF
ncbi:MAG: nuclear transport factor 2 family protein [Ornithinimicrobium sp.]